MKSYVTIYMWYFVDNFIFDRRQPPWDTAKVFSASILDNFREVFKIIHDFKRISSD